MQISVFDLIIPTEDNGYCVFDPMLEEDKNVFFHMTPASNKESIISHGFKSSKELSTGILESVSYAQRSSSCFANLGHGFESERVIFAVRFQPEALKEVAVNGLDIYVYKQHIQPEILGVVHLPKGFRLL
jgi:hypothetical protein